ncbi:MAG: putative cell survival pathways protein [Alyxoria varia]|nr:MAG: putative cell survival pathways protein [Alyxoria varia]
MNWVKQQLANVAGTQEPIYGASAIQSVGQQAQSVPYTELQRDDLTWTALESTCVETQTFYATLDSGNIVMFQLIYNSLAGLRTTCQFVSKFFRNGKEHLFASDPLSNHRFSKSKHSFYADGCSIELAEDGLSYSIKSSTSSKASIDVKFTRQSPGFMAGKDGTSAYGTDPSNPWGSMWHKIWPRCGVTGTFKSEDGDINMSGRGCFIHALQGMKPHHAAARWNFANFQSNEYSAIMMEFTTPESYGSTTVNVAGIAVDGKIIYAGADNSATHKEAIEDPEVQWPEPKAVEFQWNIASGANDCQALISCDLEKRTDRVDVMAEVPGFIKQFIAGAAGTRPYIYQFIQDSTIRIKAYGQERDESGKLFMEATFIS